MYVQIKIIFILLLTSSLALGSEVSYLSCSKSSLVVVYINGIRTDPETAYDVAKQIQNQYKSSLIDENGFRSYENKPNVVDAIYNISEGFTGDVIEALYLKLIKLTQDNGLPSGFADRALSLYYNNDIEFAKLMEAAGFDPFFYWEEIYKSTRIQVARKDREKFISKLSGFAKNGDKIFIVSHSEGTLFAKMVHDSIKDRADDLRLRSNVITHLMLAPAESRFPVKRRAEQAGEYILNLTDVVVQGVTSLPSNLRINIVDSLKNDWLGHGVTEIYMNPELKGTINGKTKFMNEHFIDFTKKSLKKLANNNELCCEMNEGFFNFESDQCNDNSCLQGFLQNTVKVSKTAKIESDKDSRLCGNLEIKDNAVLGMEDSRVEYVPDNKSLFYEISGKVTLENTSIILNKTSPAAGKILGDKGAGVVTIAPNKAPMSITGMPTIQGDVEIENTSISGSPLIEGLVTLRNSNIQANADFANRLHIKGESYGAGMKILSSTLKESVKIFDSFDIVNATIEGNGIYEAPEDNTELEKEIIRSSVRNGTFKGFNHFSGYYDVDNSLEGVRIIGERFEGNFSGAPWIRMYVGPSARVGIGAKIFGAGTVEGVLGAGSVIHGKQLSSTRAGVFLDSTSSFTGVDKRLEGAAVVYLDSTVSGTNINGFKINPINQALTAVDYSDVENSEMSGIGRVGLGSLVQNARLTGERFLVLGAGLNGTQVTNSNVYLCNTFYGAITPPANFSCTNPVTVPYESFEEYHARQVRKPYQAYQRHKRMLNRL